MWQQSGLLEVKENEPLFYIEFLTDKKIKLVRFKYNKKLSTYARHCADAPSLFGFGKPLHERYKKFNNSSMNKIVLNEILKNIVEETNE
jgi:hypothetical protein